MINTKLDRGEESLICSLPSLPPPSLLLLFLFYICYLYPKVHLSLISLFILFAIQESLLLIEIQGPFIVYLKAVETNEGCDEMPQLTSSGTEIMTCVL